MVEFSQKLFDDICERIAEGESLRKICSDDGMPTKNTFRLWKKGSPELQAQYAHAKQLCADHYAEQIIEISDDCTSDISTDHEGKPYIDGFAVQRARLMVDSRKWYASKLNPKVYGERTTVAGDPENPIAFRTLPDIIAPKAE